MKRKIIKLGTATLVTSLPAKWIKEFGLKQGDYIDVEEMKSNLILSTEKEIAKAEKKIDLKGVNTKLASYYIEAAYCIGYDRIEILHEPYITEYKTNRKISTSEFIQKEANSFIGIEIIEQSPEKTVLKDLGKVSDTEADNILRRCFLLTKDMFNECFNAIKNKNKEVLKEMDSRGNNIQRFIYYYKRILNKKGYKDFNKTAVMYHNIEILADIVGITKYIAKESLLFRKDYTEKALKVFSMTTDSINKLDSLFFTFSKEKSMEIIKERAQIWELMNTEKNKSTAEDAYLYSKLAMIVMNVSYLAIGRFYLEL